MAQVSHGTSACASSTFAPPTTNKIGAMGAVGAMVPAYFSMTVRASWVVNLALFRCYRPVIYTRPALWTFPRSKFQNDFAVLRHIRWLVQLHNSFILTLENNTYIK